MGSQPGTTAGPAAVNYSYMSGPSWPTPQAPSGGSYSYTGPGNHNQVQSPLLTQGFPNARSMYQQVSPSVPQFPQSSGRHIPDGLGGGGGGGANGGPHQMSHSQGSPQNQTTSGPPEGSFRAQQQQQQQQQYHQQQQNQHQQQQHQQHQRQQQQQRTPLPGHDISHQQQPQLGPQYPPYRTTPQQQSFPTYSSTNSQQPQPSSTTRSPPTTSTDLVLRRGMRNPMDTGAHPVPGPLGVMSGFGGGRGGGMSFGYQMPGPGGPIMTNMHQPGTPMVPVGNVGSMMPGGYNPGGPLHVYGQGHPQIHQDRPFKCDQCQQSFNRNHDLKRHKRIHMAVKPFPCTFCEKAFSRKDALKRHRLVKGCGERMKGEEARRAEDSPPDRSDIMSDTTEDSPRVAKRDTM
ncbi:hypothetical protein GE09DRAFT_1220809 [Coniochaeta sp. 2T2.1]|nr:hypothetical protein GE09DRAFT_1220809 [Coniochaeta sp. 2T2.1]